MLQERPEPFLRAVLCVSAVLTFDLDNFNIPFDTLVRL